MTKGPAKTRDLHIVINWVGGVLLVFILIGCPILKKAKRERFEARADRALGGLLSLNKVADDVEAEYKRRHGGSEIEVSVSAGERPPSSPEGKIDPKEFQSPNRLELMIWEVTEEELPELNAIIGQSLARHKIKAVNVRPVIREEPRNSGRRGFVRILDRYSVSASE